MRFEISLKLCENHCCQLRIIPCTSFLVVLTMKCECKKDDENNMKKMMDEEKRKMK
jgi:hypothetical protein